MCALLGAATGDALGLPSEGLSKSRLNRWRTGPWRHRFLFGRGMGSDDTEHAFFVAQALLTHPDTPAAFQKSLARKLQFWLLGLPAGVGFATLRAILKLWAGVSPSQSGVRSAGNGPAMRSGLIGAYFADDPVRRVAFVAASTQITHTDPRALTAALAVAEASAWAAKPGAPPSELVATLFKLDADEEWLRIATRLSDALRTGAAVAEFAGSLGCANGVTGFAYHTVPVALYSALRHAEDFRGAMESALACGGDTDTVGAIVGGVMGARVGRDGIPPEWLDGIIEWPRNLELLEKAGKRLGAQKDGEPPLGPVDYFWPGVVLRNVLFLVVVLLHGFRRLLPPY